MRRGFIVAVLSVLAVGCGSFFGGQWWALHDAHRQAAAAVSAESAAQDAAALFIVRKALASLEQGKPNDAQVVLVRYAKLKARALSECSNSAQCSGWAGSFMPTQAELAAIAAMQERP